ncbi:MAG: DUF2877 domain-containing protein [Nocardioidaceae bacterium]
MSVPAQVLASTRCQSLVDGPCQRLAVVHQSTDAWQLANLDGQAIASMVTPWAVRLPNSFVVPCLPSVVPSLILGGGRLMWDGHRVSVARWFAPARPRLPGLSAWLRPVAEIAAQTRAWRQSLGGGSGLTPYADDVLAGALVTLWAADDPRAVGWSAAVLSAPLEELTTATSAGLLRLASDGWCIEAVAQYLRAIANRQPLDPARTALVAVGHSSGRGLLEGVHRILDVAPIAESAA